MPRFSSEKIQAVWEKANLINADVKDYLRVDVCGDVIARDSYGDRTKPFGWEIDHIYPKVELERRGFSLEEIDVIDNLRPLHWENNLDKKDVHPSKEKRSCLLHISRQQKKWLDALYQAPGNALLKLVVKVDKN